MFGGRWNPRDLFGAIYLASPQETAVEEFRRMASGQAKGTTSFLPRSLVTVAVPPTRILDMTSPEAASATGLGLQEIASDDWGPCQEVAQAAHFLQFQGIRAPSTSGSGTVLVVFEDRLPLGHLRVSSQEDLSTHLRPGER